MVGMKNEFEAWYKQDVRSLLFHTTDKIFIDDDDTADSLGLKDDDIISVYKPAGEDDEIWEEDVVGSNSIEAPVYVPDASSDNLQPNQPAHDVDALFETREALSLCPNPLSYVSV